MCHVTGEKLHHCPFISILFRYSFVSAPLFLFQILLLFSVIEGNNCFPSETNKSSAFPFFPVTQNIYCVSLGRWFLSQDKGPNRDYCCCCGTSSLRHIVTAILIFAHRYQTVYLFLTNWHVSAVRWVSCRQDRKHCHLWEMSTHTIQAVTGSELLRLPGISKDIV